jgi:hypothetical protein
MSDKDKNIYKCNQCSYSTDNNHDLYKHGCKYHPKNKVEKEWSEVNFKNYFIYK